MDNKLFPKNKYNDARYPVNDPTTHPGRQSLVCRVPNGMQDTTVPVPKLNAGKTFKVKWEFTADHPGDGGIYISYDHDYGTAQTQNMRFFKIANLPQQRLLNKVDVDVKLPAWVPPGKAVLRWDWYATHNAPAVEFYSNCVDVHIVSTSKVVPTAIPSYTMQSGTGSKDAYPKYYCSEDDSCSDWCFDCDAEAWEKLKVNGPACAPGISGNCCDLSSYKAANYNVCSMDNDQAVAKCKQALQDKHGFTSCVDVGYSGGTTPGGGVAATSTPKPTPKPVTNTPTKTNTKPTDNTNSVTKPNTEKTTADANSKTIAATSAVTTGDDVSKQTTETLPIRDVSDSAGALLPGFLLLLGTAVMALYTL